MPLAGILRNLWVQPASSASGVFEQTYVSA